MSETLYRKAGANVCMACFEAGCEVCPGGHDLVPVPGPLYRKRIPTADDWRTDVSPYDRDGVPISWSEVLAAAVGEAMLVEVGGDDEPE